MALPDIKFFPHCSEYNRSVAPFLPQAYNWLPGNWSSIAAPSSESIYRIYVDTNPLVTSIAFSLFASLVFFVVSEANRNFSQVDRMWGILPALHTWHMALWARAAGVPHSRSDLVAVVVTVWCTRLTFNYWRRGGFQVGAEDYRWVLVRRWFPTGTFFLFNVSFISVTQSLLLMLLSGPACYTILLACQLKNQIQAEDILYSVLIVACVALELVGDGQQWSYQSAKALYQKDAKVPTGFKQADLDRGFVTTGLWAYSRHPSFAAEQMIWLLVYLWGCSSSLVLYSWLFAGPAMLILVFLGSTILTESISGSKYPEYAEYQRRVSKFLPLSLEPYKSQSIRNPKVIRTSEVAQAAELKQ